MLRLLTIRPSKFLGGLISFLILAGILVILFRFRQAGELHAPHLSVSLHHLPYYAWCSFYRMLIAYILSLVFAVSYGMGAAKSRWHERVMIPAIDVAQSVPVVGFFPAAIYFFIALTGGSRLGVEMAAIFLIFTSQAWNMALGVFEAIKTIPEDLSVALGAFGVSGWLRFKRLLLPASVPKLVYNSILSWVAGWYFLIACEIITVGPSSYRLPGLGSFLMESADKGRSGELIAGLLALLAIIVVMDVLIWQPLSVWAEKFRYEFAPSGEPIQSLASLDIASIIGSRCRRLMHLLVSPIARELRRLAEGLPHPSEALRQRSARIAALARRGATLVALGATLYFLTVGLVAMVRALARPWPAEAKLIPFATLASLGRLLLAYVVSLGWTLPCTLLADGNPGFARFLTPFAEIAGSMPATALFPVIVLFVIRLTGGMNLASILLILTGMQWYLLFNLLAGMRQVPEDLREAMRSLGLSRWQTWRKLTIPALFPSLITGSITAWGGGWNALILSEYFIYQGRHYQVLGLGALLDQATYESGDHSMILLSLLCMILLVMGLNRLVWRPLYNSSTERYRMEY